MKKIAFLFYSKSIFLQDLNAVIGSETSSVFGVKMFSVGRASITRCSRAATALNRSFARIKFEMPKPKEPRTKPMTGTELINSLDSPTYTQGGTTKQDKIKLNRGLNAPKVTRINPIIIGTNETIAVDILEYMTEALTSRKMKRIFKGVKDLEGMVVFEHCHVNTDLSHCYIYWSSDVSDHFANFVIDTKGEQEGSQILEVMNANINNRLQAVEGYFRHQLIKRMDFKKVPRIYFESYAKYLEKKKKRLTDNSDRMKFLREEGLFSTLDM